LARSTTTRKALAEIERLWKTKRDEADEARLELLAMLVHNYERSLEPLPPLDPIEAIKFRMDQQGLSRKDLIPVFGTTARRLGDPEWEARSNARDDSQAAFTLCNPIGVAHRSPRERVEEAEARRGPKPSA
jgi:hypothetical protein